MEEEEFIWDASSMTCTRSSFRVDDLSQKIPSTIKDTASTPEECCSFGITENDILLIEACQQDEEYTWNSVSMMCTYTTFRLDSML